MQRTALFVGQSLLVPDVLDQVGDGLLELRVVGELVAQPLGRSSRPTRAFFTAAGSAAVAPWIAITTSCSDWAWAGELLISELRGADRHVGLHLAGDVGHHVLGAPAGSAG
jgi:hypothetical protein